MYLFLQFLLCAWIGKRIKNEEDYLLGGRNLGYGLISLSLFATWFGAETCIGSSAEVFKHGLSGSRADPLGYSLCLIFSGLLIAPKIWNKKYITLADFYKERFGKSTEALCIWILSFSALIWAAAQLRAFGQVLSSTSNLNFEICLFLAFAFVLAYVVFGGLLGDILTDAIQAIIISLGLFLIFYFVWQSDFSITNILNEQSTERLSLRGQDESILSRIDRWMVPVLGSLVAQEIISRLLASRNVKVAVRSSYLSGLIYILIGCIPVFLGLVGPWLVEIPKGQEEQFITILAQKFLPVFFFPIFIGAIVSALLATIDSILISSSGMISHNWVLPKFSNLNDKSKVMVSRLVVFSCGLIAYLLAIYAQSIYALLEAASSFGTAGILVITVLGLWFSWGCNKSASLCVLSGLVLTPVYEYSLNLEAPFLTSILSCLAVFITSSFYFSSLRLPKKPKQIYN